MEWHRIIGLAAGVLTTVSFLPQVIKTIKTKSTGDISFGMYLILVIGISLWLAYGILIGSLPVIAANGVGVVLASVMLIFKVKYK